MGIKRNIKTRASILAFIMTLSAVVSLLSPIAVNAASYTGFATHPDESELVDEIHDYQSITALLQCMNIKDNDPGGDHITYSQASNAQWFGSQSVLVSLLGGSSTITSCNDLVTNAVTAAGYGKAIDLFCAFVPVNEKGVDCSDPGADQANFRSLDNKVYTKKSSGSGVDEQNYRYAKKFLDNVTSKFSLSKPARYYLYRDALTSSSICAATTSTSEVAGSYVIKDVPFVVVGKDGEVTAGSADAAERQAANLPDAWKTQTVDLTVLPVTDLRIGFNFYIGSDFDKESGPVFPISAGNWVGESVVTLAHSYENGYSAGSYPNDIVFTASGDTLRAAGLPGKKDSSTLNYNDTKIGYDFVDCAAIANRMTQAFGGDDGYKNWLFDKDVAGATDAVSDEAEAAATATTCAISGVGWIVCPVMEFITNITDSIYGIIDDWLSVDVSLLDVDSATHRGWSAMRDIANVGFVIVFLIVIFSQLTGAGISNYGVKKMLPRLVVMAVVINVSFYIAQIAVDISNILGSSLKDFLANTAVFDTASASSWLSSGNTFTDTWVKLAAGQAVVGVAAAAGIGTVAYGGIGLLVMVVLAAVLAVVVTLLILAARQALIIILIVVSPLAFLAMVMPNTKKWYDRWQQMFVALLAIYPMIAVVYGASAMAANILVSTNVILGLAVATIPLFATIPMLRGSLNAVPIAGNLASKFANRASLGGRVKAGYKQAGKNMGNDVRTRALTGGFGSGKFGQGAKYLAGGRARGAARNRRFETNTAKAEAQYTVDQALNNFDPENVSPEKRAEVAAAVSMQHKIDEEEISNIMTLNRHQNKSAADHLHTIQTATSPEQASERIAAIRALETLGGQGDVDTMASLSSLEHLGAGERSEMAAVAAKKMGTNNPAFGGASIKDITDGTFDAEKATLRYAKSNDFTTNSLLNMHDSSREKFLEKIGQSDDAEAKAAVQRIMSQIEADPQLESRVGAKLKGQLAAATRPAQSSGQSELIDAQGNINPDTETTVSLHGGGQSPPPNPPSV